MKEKMPSGDASRHKHGVIEQRPPQADPTGKRRVDPNQARRSQKQPGQDLRDPQAGGNDGQ